MKTEEINKRSKKLESELISSILFRGGYLSKVLARVSSEDFYHYRKIFDIIVDADKNGKNAQNELLLKNVGINEIIVNEANSFISRDIENICKELKNISNSRRLYSLLQNSLENIDYQNIDQYVSDFQRTLSSTVASKGMERSSCQAIIAEYKELQNFYSEKLKGGKGIVGISTGYQKLDEVIDGFRPEHLWVIGGYTNMGKSSCALNFTANLINQGKRVVYYSLEMSKTDTLSRLLGIMTNENGLTILKGYKHDKEKVEECLKKIIDSDLSIYNEKYDLSLIEGSMLEEHLNNPVDLFIVDFIQNVTVKCSRTEYETISTAILELQQLAKKLKTPIMVLSQVSNDGARSNNDVVMSFKGSGAIASASDIAIEINIGEEDKNEWRRKLKNNEPVNMVWSVRKNRHGKTGGIDMKFNGRTGVFSTLEDYGVQNNSVDF